MSQIRKNSLKATTWIYAGFLIGAINTYFLTHKNWFSTDQNGLTRAMIEISQLIFAFSTLGVTSYLYKFFPYYEDNLEPRKNDLLSVAVIIATIGFIITCSTLIFLEPVIVRKFSANSILLVEYFYWIMPMAFFVLMYNLLEAYSYGFNKGVLTSLLKETVLRLYTFIVIILKVGGFVNFRTFIILFAFQYAVLVTVLIWQLKKDGQFRFPLTLSRVTLKFKKKILLMLSLTFVVIIVSVLRQSIDGLVLAAKQNLGKVGIFGLAAYMVSVLQAPYRSIVAVTVPILSRAWKDKNYHDIKKIYQRSSINLLTFSLFIFFCIWLNFENGIIFFGINPDYLEGKWVFFLLGIMTIIELGTGVNGQIIGTSVYWRFELWTSLLLTALIIPLSYLLTVRYGIVGPAIANLVSFTVYNCIRFWFLWKKFNMQPFSIKTIEIFLIAICGYLVAYTLTKNMQQLPAIIVSLLTYSSIFTAGVYWRNISPDVKPVVNNLMKRLKGNSTT